MSRCFPFPPPACVSRGACSEALIESIKKREEEKSKKERKREKKLRKERKKERKENKRKLLSDCCTDDKVKKVGNEKYLELEKNKTDPRKGMKDEAEQLEKSDLTEEHDQPTSFESSRYFSDSTQSSNKRKRQSSSSNGNQNQNQSENQRPILRIQLSLRKHKEPDSGRPKSAQEDNTGLAGSFVQERTFSTHVPTEDQLCHTNAETNIESEKVAPKSGQELSSQTRTGKETSSCGNEFQRTELLYRTLTENWVPPQLDFCQNDLDDEEWLFGTRQQHNFGSKRPKFGNEVSCCRSSTLLWPQAQFLPEADINALPYTIPF